jgi:hypothetical protein
MSSRHYLEEPADVAGRGISHSHRGSLRLWQAVRPFGYAKLSA